MAQGPVFGRGSAVREYWLAHAEGFELVAGRRARGRVERVLLDPGSARAASLLVRRAPRRRARLVPAERIAAVDPVAQRLQLERPRPKAASSAAATRRLAAALLAALSARSLRAAAWLGPRLARGGRRAASSVLAASAQAARAGRRAGAAIGRECTACAREYRTYPWRVVYVNETAPPRRPAGRTRAASGTRRERTPG